MKEIWTTVRNPGRKPIPIMDAKGNVMVISGEGATQVPPAFNQGKQYLGLTRNRTLLERARYEVDSSPKAPKVETPEGTSTEAQVLPRDSETTSPPKKPKRKNSSAKPAAADLGETESKE